MTKLPKYEYVFDHGLSEMFLDGGGVHHYFFWLTLVHIYITKTTIWTGQILVLQVNTNATSETQLWCISRLIIVHQNFIETHAILMQNKWRILHMQFNDPVHLICFKNSLCLIACLLISMSSWLTALPHAWTVRCWPVRTRATFTSLPRSIVSHCAQAVVYNYVVSTNIRILMRIV